jgi:HEAT repeat protein
MTRVLALRPGEGRTVGLAISTAFLSSAGLMIAQSGIDALFFARYGIAKLPVMLLLLGGLMFLASLGIGALLGRFGRGPALMLIPVGIGVLAMLARIGLASRAAWIYALLWLVRGGAEFMQTLFVWGLAGIVTDTRQAKRFFPLIGGGAVLGQVVGGLVTKPLAESIGAANLVVVWIGTLAAIVILAGRLVRRSGDRTTGRPLRRRRQSALEQMTQGLRVVRRSSLMRWMAVSAVLSSLLFFSLYLPFSGAATVRYPDPDELAGFFGLFFGLSTAVAFLVSLLVTNRLLTRFGVPTVLLVLPLLYLLAFGILTVQASFAALAALRFAQIVWMQGGATSAWEAVINTVPAERRDHARAFLYGGPTQAGTILAGAIALLGEHVVSLRILYAIGLACAAVATFAMLRVRHAYPHELVLALREGRPNVFGATPGGGEPFGLARADASAVSVGIAALRDPDPGVRRLAAEILGDLDATEARAALLGALQDDEADVRATAALSLGRAGDLTAAPALVERLSDPDAPVRLAALEAVGALGVPMQRAAGTVPHLLHDPDPAIRARAATFVLERGPDEEAERTLVELATAPDAESRRKGFGALGASNATSSFELALAGMRDPVPSVRAEAARALAAIGRDLAIEPLLAAMGDDNAIVRRAVSEGLGLVGAAAVQPVLRSLFSPDLQRGAVTALQRLPLDGAADEIRRFAGVAAARAMESRRLAWAIDAGSDERLELLRDSLLARSEREAVSGLQAAALLGGRGALSVALESISVADPAQRANALEVIETVGDPDVVRPLLALWEAEPSHSRDPDWLERLRRDPDDWIRACAELVSTAREGGSMTRTLATLPLIDRVIFLRKVPLFADLPPSDLRSIASITEEHSFSDGDAIAEEGDLGDAMHIIVSGEVSIVVGRSGAGTRTLAVRSPGDVIGEMAVITSQPRMASLLARGPVRVLTIGQRQFTSILSERPETSLGVMRILCQRLSDRDVDPAS